MLRTGGRSSIQTNTVLDKAIAPCETKSAVHWARDTHNGFCPTSRFNSYAGSRESWSRKVVFPTHAGPDTNVNRLIVDTLLHADEIDIYSHKGRPLSVIGVISELSLPLRLQCLLTPCSSQNVSQRRYCRHT